MLNLGGGSDGEDHEDFVIVFLWKQPFSWGIERTYLRRCWGSNGKYAQIQDDMIFYILDTMTSWDPSSKCLLEISYILCICLVYHLRAGPDFSVNTSVMLSTSWTLNVVHPGTKSVLTCLELIRCRKMSNKMPKKAKDQKLWFAQLKQDLTVYKITSL